MNVPWIGLCEVKPLPGNDSLAGATGAFVNIVALAKDAEDFEMKTRAIMEDYDFVVLSIGDIGTIEERESHHEIVRELAQLASSLTEESPVQFDEFQAYEQ